MNKKYYIKLGKMYIKIIYINEDDIDTDFINEIDFVSDKEQTYLNLNEYDANKLIDKLNTIFKFYLNDLFEIEEVEDEERE